MKTVEENGRVVAPAMSLPARPAREVVRVVAYGVVIFSILAQGLTLKRVACSLVSR